MSKIHELSPEEIHKIAAGQVIERPLNVVKELIENAIDANAQTIIVRLYNGGLSRIEVIDDGCGMDSFDAKKAFLKHATSKISSVLELPIIKTFGFRGEALAAIKTVATVTLLTREHTATGGTMIKANENLVESFPIACPPGTTIIVENIFEKIPARKKFLKSEATESRAILQVLQTFGLLYRSIHFSLYADNILILNAPSQDDLLQKAAHLFNQKIAYNLLNFDHCSHEIILSGIITDHQYWTYDRTQIMIAVNNRWIKNQKLTSAVIKGYQGVLPVQKFPFVFCAITLDPTMIDINVHPKKDDVAFVHPRTIENVLERAIAERLKKNNLTRISQQEIQSETYFDAARTTFWNKPFSQASCYNTEQSTSFDQQMLHTKFSIINEAVDKKKIALSDSINEALADTVHHEVADQVVVADSGPASIFLGVYHNTYLLVQNEDGLVIIDQHAAHERVLYERCLKNFETLESMPLLFVQIFEFLPDQIGTLKPWLEVMKNNGIVLEQCGPTQLLVERLPVFAKEIDLRELLLEIIPLLQGKYDNDVQVSELITHTIRATLACKAAIKAGDSLSPEQCAQLIKDLSHCKNHLICPHKRPTTWMIRNDQIEKNFKRI